MIRSAVVSGVGAIAFGVFGPLAGGQQRLTISIASASLALTLLLRAAILQVGKVPTAAEIAAGDRVFRQDELTVISGTAVGAGFQVWIPFDVPDGGGYLGFSLDPGGDTILGWAGIESL